AEGGGVERAGTGGRAARVDARFDARPAGALFAGEPDLHGRALRVRSARAGRADHDRGWRGHRVGQRDRLGLSRARPDHPGGAAGFVEEAGAGAAAPAVQVAGTASSAPVVTATAAAAPEDERATRGAVVTTAVAAFGERAGGRRARPGSEAVVVAAGCAAAARAAAFTAEAFFLTERRPEHAHPVAAVGDRARGVRPGTAVFAFFFFRVVFAHARAPASTAAGHDQRCRRFGEHLGGSAA